MVSPRRKKRDSESTAAPTTTTDNDHNIEVIATTTKFKRGDHVYQWCSIAGVPRVFQHHGIVMHVEVLPGVLPGEEIQEQLTVADFSNFLPESIAGAGRTSEQQQSVGEGTQEDDSSATAATDNNERKSFRHLSSSFSSKSGLGRSTGGLLRVYTTSTTTSQQPQWHKVEYDAPRWKTLFSRSGISTTVAASDPPEVVLNRVNFLLAHESVRGAHDTFRSSVLPKYHILFANCECVATWCKTGKWSTLQAASFLTGAGVGGGGATAAAMGAGAAAAAEAAGAAGAAAAAGATATATATETVGVAAAGGLMMVDGAQPWVLSALLPYGALTVGSSAGTLLLARSKWKATTERLNEAFLQETISAAHHHEAAGTSA